MLNKVTKEGVRGNNYNKLVIPGFFKGYIIPLLLTLTWEALVHWIQGDGSYSSGITIQTQSFTIKEIVLLINVLIIKFQLECSIHTQEKYKVIYIKSKSIKKNFHHLLPYIHPTMIYKFKGPQYKLKSKFNTMK